MTKTNQITYFCDNVLTCSSEWPSGHGLPETWYAVTHSRPQNKQAHYHFCSARCLRAYAAIVLGDGEDEEPQQEDEE